MYYHITLHRQVAATVMLLVMSLTLLSLANFRFLNKEKKYNPSDKKGIWKLCFPGIDKH